MVYDLLTTVTSTRTNETYKLAVTNKPMPGIALLSTCRQVYSEATDLRNRDVTLKDTPLRSSIMPTEEARCCARYSYVSPATYTHVHLPLIALSSATVLWL